MVKKIQNRELIYSLLILLMGLILSFAVPTWETPDEMSHLRMIGKSIGVEGFADNITDSIKLERERIEYHPEEKINVKQQKQSMTEAPKYTRTEMLPKSIHLSVIKHLPATIGILLGILLGIPAYWTLQLGEIFALLFYTAICYMALKIIPLKKDMLAMVMLFPMAIQQASSLNYDAVLLPMCFLFISYIFYLKYEKEEIGFREILTALLILGIAAYTKMPYVFLGFLFLILPLSKIKVDLKILVIDESVIKKIRIPVCIAGGGCVLGVAYIGRHNLYIQIVYGFVREWQRGLYLLQATGRTWTRHLMESTVGKMGWLDTPISFKVVIVVFAVVAVVSCVKYSDSMYKLKAWDTVVVLGTFCVLCVFITISLANHTIMVTLFGSEFAPETYHIRQALYQIPYIGGLQGRYYLPFVPLIFLVLPEKIQMNKKIIAMGISAFEILLYGYVIYVLACRYWIS